MKAFEIIAVWICSRKQRENKKKVFQRSKMKLGQTDLLFATVFLIFTVTVVDEAELQVSVVVNSVTHQCPDVYSYPSLHVKWSFL